MFYKNEPDFQLQPIKNDRSKASRKAGKKLFAALSFVILTILLSSCGVWRNFTTYFNTYYNAKTLFDNIEEQIKSQRKDIFEFREDIQKNATQTQRYGTNPYQNPYQNQQQTNPYQYQNQNQYQQPTTTYNQSYGQPSNPYAGQTDNSKFGSGTKLTGQLNQDLTRVIEKCSKILQYDKESSYFPDALFLTGKALYYQQEYARAQRKFLELAALGPTKYTLENNLWLAKTYLQLRSFDDGLKLIDSVQVEAKKEGENKLFIDASITKISFYLFREDYPKAVDECKNFIANSPDEEITGQVSFELGKIYETLDDYQKALDTFASVEKYSPSFDIEFQSKLEHARLLKKLNRVDDAEAELTDLRYSGKFRNNLDQVMIELGQIYSDKNQIKTAIDTYLEVDSTFKQTPSAGIADFRLADIYEKKVRDYDSSYKYFNKASGSLAPAEIKVEASNRNRNIDRYNQLKSTITSYELGKLYLSDPMRFERDSVDYEVAAKENLNEAQRMLDEQRAQTTQNNPDNQQMTLTPEQSRGQLLIYQQKIIANAYKDLRENKRLTLAQLIAINKVQKPIKPKISADSIKTMESQEMYSLGSLFFSELDVPDSAYFYFKKILNDYPTKPVTVKTMYALGTYYETSNDSLKADSLYRYIYDHYEKDPLRAVVAERLGLLKKEESKAVVVKIDDNDPAKPLYIEAENKYFDKKYNDAIEGFRDVYKKYPKSPFAPKAVYYIGMIYEDNLVQNDSAAATYGLLITDYKTSPLVAQIMQKYTNYQTEKIREKTLQDQKIKDEQAKQQQDKKKTETDNKVQNEVKKETVPQKPVEKEVPSDSVKNKVLNRMQPNEKKPIPDADTTKKAKKIPD